MSSSVPDPALGMTPLNLVTTPHVKEALAADKGNKAHLNSWSVEGVVGRGDNYASHMSCIKAKFSIDDEDSEVNYVVKINPCRNLDSFREFTRAIFKKEINFYMALLPEMNLALIDIGQKPLRFPKCYHVSKQTDRELIIMEDLRDRGFKMVDRTEGLDIAHTTLALEELARLHAASLLVQSKHSDEDLTHKHEYLLKDLTTHDDKNPDALLPMFQGYLRQAEALMSQIEGYEKVVSWIQSLKPRMREVLEEQTCRGRYNAVCHGDCWSNNLLYRYNETGDPEEVMLVDMQLVRYASPATDLTMLLYTSLTGPTRRTNFDVFLDSYLSVFSIVMKAAGSTAPFTHSQLYEEFKNKAMLGAIFAMIIIPLVFLKAENVPDLSVATDENFADIMNEFKVKTQEILKTHPLFQPRLVALFDDLMEIQLIS